MVFWFFNALNKNYTANISFPVAFDFAHEHYISVRQLPQTVKLNVTGIGWNLFRKSLGIKVLPLLIPLKQPTEIKKIVGSTLPAIFSNQMEGIQINYCLMDTLYLDIEPKAGRWIKVGLDSIAQFLPEGYCVPKEVTISPDSVYVLGPMGMVSKIKEPLALSLPGRVLDQEFSEEIEVVVPGGKLMHREPDHVFVAIHVERCEEVKDSIKLEWKNPSARMRVMGIGEKVYCVFNVPRSMRSSFDVDSVRAVLDINRNSKGVHKRVPELEGLPSYVTVVHIDSVTVKH